MKVVNDSTPLIHLAKAGGLGLLQKLYGSIYITKAVYREAVEEGELLGEADAPVIKKGVGKWINIGEVTGSERIARKYGLHLGEATSIALALEQGAGLLLMNEREGRDAAKKESLKIKGTIGVIQEAVKKGVISAEEGTGILRKFKGAPQEYWIDPAVIDAAIKKI
ncbi:hypothetical protein IPdc08_01586 [archaeon]|nr:hypothetical protein IPdc08_01586 [archaeon]